ncbi:MAG: c-type cytochrome [Candidatus Lambdaproteobacteria bacterium]|nr:c-type cytochrome [Candidatus Lambdaproteobacteria bacterium]
MRRWWMAAGLALALAVGAAAAARAQGGDPAAELQAIRSRLARLDKPAPQASGRAIYVAACADCHGMRGDSRGPGAKRFPQRPTDFTKGVYKLRTTLSQTAADDLPTDADIVRTIREGMPGTEMVPFRDVLTAESIMAVALYIKSLSPRFANPALASPDANVFKVPEQRPFERSEASIAKGKEVYLAKNCQECHGEDGSGNTEEKDTWGYPVQMLSFKLGTYKSGTGDRDLYRSISTGMRGTTMEYYGGSVTDEETWQLVDYIRSLAVRPTSLVGRFTRYLLVQDPSGFNYRPAPRR